MSGSSAGEVWRVEGAKELVLDLMRLQLGEQFALLVDPASPDGDRGKFTIAGEAARVVHHFSGWHPQISSSWFAAGIDPPVIHRTPFRWYVFAIPDNGRHGPHYFVCDYFQMREWVLDFSPPPGSYDHRDHRDWRADLHLFPDPQIEREGYFRWGDEPTALRDRPGRVFQLDNIATVMEVPPAGTYVGTFAPGGESSAHRLLKLYVASHGTEFGLSPNALPHVEYSFATGDRVDVMFENHLPDRTVIEIEVAGDQNVCVGIMQAIKYRSLAAVDAGFPLVTSRVRSLVVAYDTNYQRAADLAERYDIELISVDREHVLASAS